MKENPKNLYLNILRLLQDNLYLTESEIKLELKIQDKNIVIRCLNRLKISELVKDIELNKIYYNEITPKGLEYLSNLELKEIQQKQVDIANNQTKLLSASFWIYSLTAFFMFGQIAMDFIYKRQELTKSIFYQAASTLLLIGALFLIIWGRIKNVAPLRNDLTWYEWTLFILALIGVIYAAIYANSHQENIKVPIEIKGNITVNNLESLNQNNDTTIINSFNNYTLIYSNKTFSSNLSD